MSPTVWALELALGRLDLGDADAGTVALARRYALDIDEAQVVSTQAAKLLREVQGWMEPATYDRFQALADRIEKTAVLALLGPKLLAAMTELGMTPRARADVTRKGGAAGDTPTDNPLARFRAERATRLKRQSGGVNAS